MSTSKPDVLVLDSVVGEYDRFGHLLSDDKFWAECIAPLASRMAIKTSAASLAGLSENQRSSASKILYSKLLSRVPSLHNVLRTLSVVPSRGTKHVVFPAFEEIPALAFMLLHPRLNVHLVFHNNLSVERLVKHRRLYPMLMRAVFRRAASLMVCSRFQVDFIRELDPEIDASKIVLRPSHQSGYERTVTPLGDRRHRIVFMGPASIRKPIDPVIDLIKADVGRRFEYVLRRMTGISSSELEFLEQQPNVDLSKESISDEQYFEEIGSASFLLATHTRLFEGKLSGPISDAISCGTPIICRDMEPHTEMFETFGDIGYVCDFAKPDWAKTLLTDDFESRHSKFERNLSKCREASSIDSVRNIIKERLSL